MSQSDTGKDNGMTGHALSLNVQDNCSPVCARAIVFVMDLPSTVAYCRIASGNMRLAVPRNGRRSQVRVSVIYKSNQFAPETTRFSLGLFCHTRTTDEYNYDAQGGRWPLLVTATTATRNSAGASSPRMVLSAETGDACGVLDYAITGCVHRRLNEANEAIHG